MRIDTRPSQWVVVALLVGWMGLVGWVAPQVAASIPSGEEVAAGESVSAGGVSLTPVEGWAVATDVPTLLILRKQGAQLVATPPAPASGDAASMVQAKLGTLAADTSTDWTLGDPVSFTTADGSDGAYAVGLAPQQFITWFAVVVDGTAYVVNASGTDTDWTTLHDEIVEIVKTLRPAGGAS